MVPIPGHRRGRSEPTEANKRAAERSHLSSDLSSRKSSSSSSRRPSAFTKSRRPTLPRVDGIDRHPSKAVLEHQILTQVEQKNPIASTEGSSTNFNLTKLRSSSWENQFGPGRTKEFIRLRKESLWTPGNDVGAGLCNLGNTCFMNAALQCLSHTAPITDFFVGTTLWHNDLHKENPSGTGGKLAEEFAALLDQLFGEPDTPASPSSFKAIVSRFAPQYSGTMQHDCQEFMAYLLDGLHEDLNRVSKKPYHDIPDANGRPDEVVAAEQWKLHLMRDRSIIVDIMQGQLKSSLTCEECGYVSVKFDPFMYLSLPVIADEEEVDLESLLDAFLRPERLSGDEQWYCSKCKKHVDAVKKFDLWKLPPVLMIHLKRFKYSRTGVRTQKINTMVNFPVLQLELDDYTSGVQRDQPVYDLYAVSRHMGGTGSGHYNAVVRGRSGHQWYMFDDSRRTKVPTTSVQDKQAYLLFYQRRTITDRGYRRQSINNPANWPHQLAPRDLDSIIRGHHAASPSNALKNQCETTTLETEVGVESIDPTISISENEQDGI